MKKMDESGTKLCRAQAELFVSSISLTKCSSPIFLRRFMNSSAAKRMDAGSFLFEANTNESIIKEIEKEDWKKLISLLKCFLVGLIVIIGVKKDILNIRVRIDLI